MFEFMCDLAKKLKILYKLISYRVIYKNIIVTFQLEVSIQFPVNYKFGLN